MKAIAKPRKAAEPVRPVARGNGAGSKVEPNIQGRGADTLGAAEKLLLGLAPTAQITLVPPALAGVLRTNAIATRTQVVQAFLARNPDLKEELEQEAEETWQRSGGRPEEFSAATAERRARLLSLARLSNLAEVGPAAVQSSYNELARYLAEMYGIG
jgi:hypothetical protein